jgi:hypothetical protein
MPDSRQHRGAHPSDDTLFDTRQIPALCTANAELSWLLSRGYAITSTLKLVGDHHGLCKRQRVALSRAACSDQSKEARQSKCLAVQDIQGQELIIDGFNLLITIEAALSGGVILRCRDGCLRDLSSVHGSYRSVQETQEAISLIGNVLEEFNPASVEWLFDKPVSNSGRLAQRVRNEAEAHKWPWHVDVTLNPDKDIIISEKIAISSDSSVLDGVAKWTNFSAYLIPKHLPQSWLVDLENV